MVMIMNILGLKDKIDINAIPAGDYTVYIKSISA